MNFQMFKLVLEKAEEPDQIANNCWIIKKAREFQKNVCFCFIDYAKPLTAWTTTNWKILKEMRIPDHPTCLLRNLYAAQEATVRTEHNWQQTDSKLGKECVKDVCCHPVYFSYKQSTSCEILGWMKHKLESRLPGEMSITSGMQITPPLWQNLKRN